MTMRIPKARHLTTMGLLVMLLLAALPSSAQIPTGAACFTGEFLEPRLQGGMYARVTEGPPNNVREEPTTNSPIVGTIEAGTQVYVTSAPRCQEGLVWWQVQYRPVAGDNDFPFGWTAEGADGDYWLEPVLQPLNLPTNRPPITPANAANVISLDRVEYGLVNAIDYAPDGRHVAISTVGSVWVYDLTQPRTDPLWLIPNRADTNETTSIVWGVDTIRTAGGPDGRTAAWSLADGVQQRAYGTGSEFVGTTALDSTGTLMAVAQSDGSIVVLDTEDGFEYAILTDHTFVGDLSFTPDSTVLVSVGGGGGMGVSDNSVRFWDINGNSLGVVDTGFFPQLNATGNTLVVPERRESGDVLLVIDTTTQTERAALPIAIGDNFTLPTVFISDDGSKVAIAVSDQASFNDSTPLFAVTIFETDTGASAQIRGEVPGVRWSIGGHSFTPDGTVLALGTVDTRSGSSQSGVSLIDTATAEIVGEIITPEPVEQMTFSTDGTLLTIYHQDPQFWPPPWVTFWGVR